MITSVNRFSPTVAINSVARQANAPQVRFGDWVDLPEPPKNSVGKTFGSLIQVIKTLLGKSGSAEESLKAEVALLLGVLDRLPHLKETLNLVNSSELPTLPRVEALEKLQNALGLSPNGERAESPKSILFRLSHLAGLGILRQRDQGNRITWLDILRRERPRQ